MSFIFLGSRGLAAGVAVYASAIVLSVCLAFPLWATILMVGIVTIIYDTIGGITAVVYSREEFRHELAEGRSYFARTLNGPRLMVTGDEWDLARLITGAEEAEPSA